MSADHTWDTVITPSLELRRLQEVHRALVHDMDADARIRAAERVRVPEITDRFVTAQLEHWARHGFGMWIAFERESQQCAGRGGLRHIVVEGQYVVQVGYGFFPAYWGRGFATELATAATNAADSIGLARIVALARPTNAASRRVLEKTGFASTVVVDYEGLPHVLYERARPASLDPPASDISR
jgi:RimJ/RimL family protein N-acetyltransferase